MVPFYECQAPGKTCTKFCSGTHLFTYIFQVLQVCLQCSKLFFKFKQSEGTVVMIIMLHSSKIKSYSTLAAFRT